MKMLPQGREIQRLHGATIAMKYHRRLMQVVSATVAASPEGKASIAALPFRLPLEHQRIPRAEYLVAQLPVNERPDGLGELVNFFSAFQEFRTERFCIIAGVNQSLQNGFLELIAFQELIPAIF